MALAEETALRSTDAEYLLWVNDDIDLYPDALDRLITVALNTRGEQIVVGTFIDPGTGVTSYGGLLHRDRYHPMRFARIEPKETAQAADTFNGNLVLVPRAVAERLGGIDRRYPHTLADLDYGLRARRMGIGVLVAPAIVGACVDDHSAAPFDEPGLELRQRLAIMNETRNLPWRARALFLRQHGGPLWPIYLPSAYLRLVGRHLMDRLGRAR
jgi:GT2 family glycosyltransferase